jgi:tetratricopeptide (TPR) repeat protein
MRVLGAQIIHQHWTRSTTWASSIICDRGKLDEAEKMYQRALQGYEKTLGLKNVARYRPALNTIWNLGDLFAAQRHLDKAKEMYIMACAGFQVLLGPSSNECQCIERGIASLDATQGKCKDISISFAHMVD